VTNQPTMPHETTSGDVIEKVAHLIAGARTALLPLLALSLPCAVAVGVFGTSLAAVAAVAGLAVALVAAVLAPPFLLFRSLARRRSHLPGELRQPSDTRP
jgi:hypothetical protein